MTGADAAWERSARFWLRAYPRRWRAARGEELLGVLADLAAPGAARIDARTALDLVRAGWLTRLRTRPPLHRWLGYRLLDARLPKGFRAWAYDDISGPLYGARVQMIMGLIVAVILWRASFDGALVAAYLALLVLVSATPAGYRHRQAILRHVAPRPGEMLFRGQLVVADGPRHRVAARSGLRAIVATAGLFVLAATVAATVAPLGWWVGAIPSSEGIGPGWEQGLGPVVDRSYLPVVVLLGALLAAVLGPLGARRVRRISPRSVLQPHRDVRRLGRRGAASLAVWTAAGLALLVLEAAGVLAVGLSVVVLLVGPGVLAIGVAGLRGLSHGADDDVALVDVWRAATTGRPPLVDGPLPVVVPNSRPVPEGAVVAPGPLGGPPTTLMA